MNSIIEKTMLLVEKISNTTKMFKTFGTNVNIYRSEIHIIQLIGDQDGLHITEISRLIGVTKGTISQIIKRLECKELVYKQVDVGNNTRQLISLTEKGIVAYRAHEDYHRNEHKEMETFLNTLNGENRKALEKFLDKATEMFEEH